MANVLKRDRDRRRKQADAMKRLQCAAQAFFEQLIEITEGAYDGVDTLKVDFNNQWCVIDLINYREPIEEEEQIQEEENEFIHILYNIMYTHYQLEQPVEFDLTIGCPGRRENPQFPQADDPAAWFQPTIEPNEDIGSYELRTHVLPAMRKLFTDDHDDHGDWTYGRRTFSMKDDGDKVSCVINWNRRLPNAGAAAYALGKRGGVPNDLIQYALEWEQRNYAKRFKRDPEQWMYDPCRRIIVESDSQR